ncbi:putative transposase for insertion sequence element (plasmid) [Acidiphilium multivorum AIU301]|uniref:Putative transposase for insertion sequence element n=1 Tax=Acidiphilium multivorum (strain DSM 11245 / JCM 8867 / NBRC 100883 / AIU 301) TaxID=926570 RepID=F0J7I3_ACIMA|nr:IS5 family transposase [Acidiphilium multivorum]BAJ83050.1 putative transposase for insertion sequence element [Acidiphilium multivorum AIU301]
MPPKLNASQDDLELFRSRLENIIDQRHPLTRLARLIDWRVFEERFGALYAEAAGRPALPTRLMVALHLLKHMDRLSDEAICARYLDSPYVQAFCGETHFQHTLPLDRSSMTRWRKRIGAERMEALLAETLAAAERGGAVAEKHYERVTIDTTVQPKAVTHPTDSKLLHRGIETLARMARRHGITLRQSYRRVARYARQEAARLHHGGKRHEAEARVRKLRTWLGRLARDITRKIAGNAEAKAAFAETLGVINRLLRQKRSDRGADKLYSLHAPEVECIGKGKARTRFEFGVKVSIATTNAAAPGGQFVLGMQSQPGNPYDGHTLAGQIEQVERITGVAVARAYRGHGVEAEGRRIFISRQKRGITPTIRRELRRRTAIEPVIGHMKTNGHLGRNFLLGVDGDAINAVLAGAGHNLRLLRRWLIRLLCALVAWLSAPNRSPSPGFTHRQIT